MTASAGLPQAEVVAASCHVCKSSHDNNAERGYFFERGYFDIDRCASLAVRMLLIMQAGGDV